VTQGAADVLWLLPRRFYPRASASTTGASPFAYNRKAKPSTETTKARLKSLPDLPTADEAGLNGFELGVWHGIFAPRGTPPAVVQKLSVALKSALKEPDLVKGFNDMVTPGQEAPFRA
jgi:tripartite-type tricarboxylate transporter receptor subunit TctC